MTASVLVAALRTAAGTGGAVRTSTDDLAAHAVCGVTPSAVVEPADAEAVAAVLVLCADAGVPVEPAGGASWLGAGRRGRDAPIVLSTRRLTGVTEYEPSDLVVGVRAGTTLAALAERLRRHTQALPLDPPAGAGATVGATLALAAAGPLRARHGTPRDFALGVEVVTGDGRLLRFGGRVVKNVAGYDGVRMLVGSRGVLGVLVSAWLLLRAAAEADRSWVARVGSAAEAAALALAVRDGGVADAVEVLRRAETWQVAVRVRGTAPAVTDALGRLGALAGEGREADDELWNVVGAGEAGAVTCFRLAAPPAALRWTLELAERLTEGQTGWSLAAHGTAGIVRVWRPAGAGVLDPAMAQDLADRAHAAREALAGAGGTLNCPILEPALQGMLEPWDAPSPAARMVMERLRNAFDPAGILSPGRHVI